MKWFLGALGLLLMLALTGCGPFADERNIQERADTPSGDLGGNLNVGERFVAGCDGLAEVEVQLAVYPVRPRGSGDLVLDVARASQPTRVLGEARYAETAVTPNKWIGVTLPAVSGSRDQSFVLTVRDTSAGLGAATPWATNHWSDPADARLVGGETVPGSLVYRAWCAPDPWSVTEETLASVERQGLLWPIALLMCLLPGLGVAGFLDRPDGDLAARLGGAVGWSILLAPLALVALTPARGAPVAALALPLLGGTIGLGLGFRAQRQRARGARSLPWDPVADGPTDDRRMDTSSVQAGASRVAAALALGATVLAIGIRAVVVKDLVVPAWGDSPQHTYVVQQILRVGGLPSDYGPLVPPQVFDYHFGFQSVAAFAAILTRQGAPGAVLVVGQALDALVCLAVYRFARDLTQSPWAGAVAAVLVAFVTVEPTYYASWGRYPELAGLVALPAGFAATRSALGPCPRRRDLAAAVVAFGAMVLVHPRTAIFLAALAIAEALARPTVAWRFGDTLRTLARLVALGAIALVLISPWIVRLWVAHHRQLHLSGLATTIDFPLDLALSGDDRWVVIVALVGLALAAWRESRLALLGAIWFGLVLVAANPTTFRLPFNLALNNGAVAIAVFLPATVFVGYLADRLGREVAARIPDWPSVVGTRVAPWGAAAVILAAGLTQAPKLVGLINPTCVLVRPGDRSALAWVAKNTPTNARFLVESFLWAPEVNAYMGSDAGYWLPMLAGRQTSLPPLFYGVGPAAEVRAVDDVAAKSIAAADHPDDVARLARSIGARYVFVGTRGGSLDPGALVASGQFQVAYGADGAWVLELVADATGNAANGGDTVRLGLGVGEDSPRPVGVEVRAGGPSTVKVGEGDGEPTTVRDADGTMSSTLMGVTPLGVGTPRATNAAGLKSSTSG